MGTFIATVFGLCAAVKSVYPDKISAPKTYPDGLEAELGGKGALPVSLFLLRLFLSNRSKWLTLLPGEEARSGLVGYGHARINSCIKYHSQWNSPCHFDTSDVNYIHDL